MSVHVCARRRMGHKQQTTNFKKIKLFFSGKMKEWRQGKKTKNKEFPCPPDLTLCPTPPSFIHS
jgi:hypothetical protein